MAASREDSPTEAKFVTMARSYIEKLDDVINRNKYVSTVLETVKEKTGVKRSYIVAGFAVVILVFLAQILHAFWHVIGGVHGILTLLTYAITVAYPVGCSLSALETTDQKEHTKWLTYWICLSSIFFLEQLLPPLKYVWNTYVLLKMAVLFAMLPNKSFNGSALFHKSVLRPVFELIKPHLKVAQAAVKQAIDKTSEETTTQEVANGNHIHNE